MSRAVNKYGELGSERPNTAVEMSMPVTTSANNRDSRRKTPREEPSPIVRTKSVSVQPPRGSKPATTKAAPESSTQAGARNHTKRKPVGTNKGHARNRSRTDSTQRLNVYSPAPSDKDSIVSSTHSSRGPSVSSISSVDEIIPIKIDLRGTPSPPTAPSSPHHTDLFVDFPIVPPPSPAKDPGPDHSTSGSRKAVSAPAGTSLLRAFSDSAMYANSFHEKLLLRRPAFLSRQKTNKTPLTALQEQSQLSSMHSPQNYVLPEIGPHDLQDPFTLYQSVDSPSQPVADPAQTVSKPKSKTKAKSVFPSKPKPTFQLSSKSLSPDPIPLEPIISTPKASSSTTSSKFKFRFTEKAIALKNLSPKRSPTQAVKQVVDAVRSPTQKVKHVVDAVMDKEGGEKVVCGLPCNSRRKEKELTYTLEILTGMRVRKVDKETEEKGFKIGKMGTKRIAKKKSKALQV